MTLAAVPFSFFRAEYYGCNKSCKHQRKRVEKVHKRKRSLRYYECNGKVEKCGKCGRYERHGARAAKKSYVEESPRKA